MNRLLSYFTIVLLTAIATGCGSGTDSGNKGPAPSKSTLKAEVIETIPPASPVGGMEWRVDYDQTLVRPAKDLNENPANSISLNGGLSVDGTLMMAYDNGDTLTLNIINAGGFKDGEKNITIDFDIINGTPGSTSYTIVPGTFKLFDLDGGRINNGVEIALGVTNR
ncbi:MAG: hypothetical protein HZB32_01395 [Nitrospirae bacterium]|nr:hypothetical protein [Nitrospirota bacterium]